VLLDIPISKSTSLQQQQDNYPITGRENTKRVALVVTTEKNP
jgi:hypothetical protein